jgi:hypothetical protein
MSTPYNKDAAFYSRNMSFDFENKSPIRKSIEAKTKD